MDTWYQRFIKWFSDIPPDVPATVIRKTDHVVVIVRPGELIPVPDAEVVVPVKKAARKKSVAKKKPINRWRP